MATAYAGLVSLMHIINQIQHHPRPPISLEKEQVESLSENITFLQDFLEGFSHVGSEEVERLATLIADAAHAAEDIIESYVADRILSRSIGMGKIISFMSQLQKVIEDMDFIKKDVMRFKEKMRVRGGQHLHGGSSNSAGLLRSPSTGQHNTMVGHDDAFKEVMDQLLGQRSDLQIIPIVGMGGIGKTTLARNISQDPIVVQHFDILTWVNISQEYRMREILLELVQEGPENLSQKNEYELGERLHKRLSGRRYLIIMDDIWDIEVWDQLKSFFPDYNNGSRIMLTTRLSNLASQVANSHGIKIGFLDNDDSWNLFSKIVFGKEGCPLELEEIGKKIVKNCRGLPLSIVVIGGLLAKSKHTREYWEYIEENLNSIVNLEDNERCLKILRMSYNQLPIYLKPCFLYVGVFHEDAKICVAELVQLWVAEGFLRLISGKSLEEIAEDYLKELINRNLILVHKLGSTGNIKYCKIHDLLRELCLIEAQKERFFYNVTRPYSLNPSSLLESMNTERRIVIPDSTSEERVEYVLQSMSLARSLLCDWVEVLPFHKCRLLRIFRTHSFIDDFQENMFQCVNSRYLDVIFEEELPSSVNLLWNLSTLTSSLDEIITAPVEIWSMPLLRHVKFSGFHLPDPPSGGQDDIVLANLQTLKIVLNFKCSEEVVKRIPNIRELSIYYYEVEGSSSNYYVNNLDRLNKLESFRCDSYPHREDDPSATDFLQNLTFPHWLKKLRLIMPPSVHWEDMLEKIGSLPLLEKLQLCGGSFKGRKWETVEGQFRSLKFLKIYYCEDLEYWIVESSPHFPRLEHLVLDNLVALKEVPSEIGEISTLQSIKLRHCQDSAVISAKKILEEHEELNGEGGLQVRVRVWGNDRALMNSLASPNFHVEWWYF